MPALALAAAVAAVNVACGWWVGRVVRRSGQAPAGPGAPKAGERWWWLQGAALLARVVLIFGAAHALWRRSRDASEVVVFIVAAAVLQLVGQVSLHLRGERDASA